MKKLVFLFSIALAVIAPSYSFAIVANTHQTVINVEKPAKKEMKKSTKITLILSVGFVALAYVLKIAGASAGILAFCYILALIAVILCIGSLFKK